jgi:NADPH-dependent 2,4-dienoyl-CoA reductase/sulfur reductase-like enzyme/rhodanese-related sulfurtransferase
MPTTESLTPLRLIVIGGVAGGATAAARARRLDEHAEITVLERGPYVSYANCGLPYFIARDIRDRESLLLATPESFARRYRIAVRVNTEAIEIDTSGQRVHVRGPSGEEWLPYDRLILGQGGTPVHPALPGADGEQVFTFWNIPDMDRLDEFLREREPKTAVVVGAGFIGLEMAEAFHARGLATSIVELFDTPMPLMDREFGVQITRELARHDIKVFTRIAVRAVDGERRVVELTDGRTLPADVVLFATGVRPEMVLAQRAGLAIGKSGGLLVNDHLRTSDPNIWAAGDMIEVEHVVSGRRARIPLAGPANRQGRLAASNALGHRVRYTGALGTSVVKVLDATAAMTGLTERVARELGYDVGVATVHSGHHARYYPGARELSLKLVYDRSNARLLGAQAFGHAGVDKRMDVLATALHGHMTLHDLARLDLSYAPPFSSANDPVNVAAFVGENDIAGYSPSITAAQLDAELASGSPPLVLDVRNVDEFAAGHLPGAVNIPVDALREALPALPSDRRIAVHCKAGFRGHLAVRILKQRGYTDVVNVTGGWVSLDLEHER